MINYEMATMRVLDYNDNNVATLYSAKLRNDFQASDISVSHEESGWKELSFSLPHSVNGIKNELVDALKNEYLIEIDDGSYEDVFVISEPSIHHNETLKLVDVKCNHKSSRLRTKKLYLTFDETNGVGTCGALVEIILAGTGWTVGRMDRFYESDGTTEKIRTLSSSGKEGAYQLIGKVCELFNARPVFNGKSQTVDIIAFAPYVKSEDDGSVVPLLTNPDSVVELHYSKGMSGIKRTLNTENLITRMYVEGEYGTKDGYLGIEEVNPLKTNFLLNFDYFKATGLFNAAHQAAIDRYIAELRNSREEAVAKRSEMSEIETMLMDLWGTADYGIYSVSERVSNSVFVVSYETSLGGIAKPITVGTPVTILLNDGTYVTAKITNVSGQRITIDDNVDAAKSIEHILMYRTPATASIGGKETAVQAMEETRRGLLNRVGDNIAKESDVSTTVTTHLVRRYFLTDNWEPGRVYTISIWGTLSDGQQFVVYADETKQALLATLEYDNDRKCFAGTFTCPNAVSSLSAKNLAFVFNNPASTTKPSSIQRIKIEYGEMGTPWRPATEKSNQELIAEYDERIRDLYYGVVDPVTGAISSNGLYDLTRQAVSLAIMLEGLRGGLSSALADINNHEAEFSLAMGDMLRDGYWNDKNYIVGQEQSLYNDAAEIMKVMAFPVASYDISFNNIVGTDALPLMQVTINSAAHIIDPEIGINTWGYVNSAKYVIDAPYKNTLQISTQEAKFSGESFTQVLSKIAETAKDIQGKQSVYARASIISKDGHIPSDTIEGVIDVEVNRLLSKTSNMMTDERGNLIFTSQDGMSAMMLTGEGFMIADGKKIDGTWNWRAFGSGRGFSADEITAGTLQAGIVKILGTDQFFWDSDNIYIFDPTNPDRQIRIGRYDGENYGIGFTQDNGASWVSAFDFDGINLNYSHVDVSNITGLGGMFLTPEDAEGMYAPKEGYDTLLGDFNALNANLSQSIRFDASGITISQTDGMSTKFTSTSIDFYDGADKIAYIQNRALNIDEIRAVKKMSVGKFVWYSNVDGSVSAKWDTQ